MAKRAVLQLTIRVYGMEGSSSVVKVLPGSRCLRRGEEEVDVCLMPMPLYSSSGSIGAAFTLELDLLTPEPERQAFFQESSTTIIASLIIDTTSELLPAISISRSSLEFLTSHGSPASGSRDSCQELRCPSTSTGRL